MKPPKPVVSYPFATIPGARLCRNGKLRDILGDARGVELSPSFVRKALVAS